MIRDYQTEKALRGAYDFCIVGGGPAGITLALRLAKAGWSVVLLEAGGQTYADSSQTFYDCSSTGLELYPHDTRLRFLGGTSNHWAGRCRPFDATDFSTPPQGACLAGPSLMRRSSATCPPPWTSSTSGKGRISGR